MNIRNKLSSKKFSEHKIILLLGILFFVLGTLINIFSVSQSENDIYNFQSPLLLILSDLTPLKILIFTIIVFPFLEEIVFRLWTIRKRFAYIVSLIGISLIIFQISNSFLIFALTTLILFLSFFWIKNTIVIAVITSIVFALIHYGNIDSSLRLINLLPYFGLALILSFIGLRFKFFLCILAHSAYNLIAMLPLIFFSNQNTSVIQFESDTYTAELTKVSFFSSIEHKDIINHDTIDVVSTLPELIPNITPFNNEAIYTSNVTSLNKYRLSAFSKPNKEISTEQLSEDLQKRANISSDTIIIKAHVISLNDNVSEQPNNHGLMTLYDLVNYLRIHKDLPVKLSKEISSNETILFSTKILNMDSYSKIIETLNNDSVLNISLEKEGELMKVSFFEKRIKTQNQQNY
ncbi:MAG TPA: CPBP family intramembrane metalloprotease [Salinivirgaceae bacterium]|nr:CPBP family intramembrane metalloprotease [Salinivirgaceae bacterium]HQA75677.1 CPBP family intramembrane metalloprotease [Salinivirgaceae bacterium]